MAVEDVLIRLKILGRGEAKRDLGGTTDDLDSLGREAEQTGRRGRDGAAGLDIMGAASRALKGGAAAGVVALRDLAAASIRSASDLEQATGGVESVFGAASTTVKRFADNAALNVGLAKSEYSSLASVVGSQLQRMGQSQDESATSTDKLITLGADLAATYGGTVSDAVGAVSSLLRGERDPIERYAVGIKQADIDARLAADGLGELQGAAKTQAESQATLALLFEQTANAQGAFGRESNTLAGRQERLRAQFENVKASIGAALLPMMQRVTGFLSDTFIPAAERLIAAFKDGDVTSDGFVGVMARLGVTLRGAFDYVAGTVVPALVDVGRFISRNTDVVAGLVAGFVAYRAIMATIAVATAISHFMQLARAVGVARAVMLQFNITMFANPIGLVVLAVAALVAGLVIAYQRSETFRDIVNGAFSAVAGAAAAAFGWVRDNWPLLLAIITGPIGLAVLFVVRHWDEIKFGAGAAKDFIVGRFNDLVGFVTGLPGRISASVGGMWDGISESFRGALNWIIDAWNGLSLTLPSREIFGKKIGGFTLNTPDIPPRAAGGPVWPGPTFLVGEDGPELLQVGGRAFITPTAQTMDVLGQTQARGSLGIATGGTRPMPQVVAARPPSGSDAPAVSVRAALDGLTDRIVVEAHLHIDGREVETTTTDVVVRRQARQ